MSTPWSWSRGSRRQVDKVRWSRKVTEMGQGTDKDEKGKKGGRTMTVASNIDAEATNKCNGLFTNLKVMEDFMHGALGNQKVFLLKLHAGVQNLGIVKESHSRDMTWPLCIEHFIHMSAQVKLPVKKKIHWKGFIKLLSLHSIQMYNWLRNLTLEDVFLLDYSCKDTTFWDALWVACQDDSMHQLGL